MFAIVRRKSHSVMARREFAQGVEHFKQAATHAARGTGATMGPKITTVRGRVQPAAGRVRDAASSSWISTVALLAPLAAAASDGARQARKDSGRAQAKTMKSVQKKTKKAAARQQGSRRGGKLTGLLIAGAALGAAGAVMMRRRKAQQWDEYDPNRPMSTGPTAETSARGDAAFEPSSSLDPAAQPTTGAQPQTPLAERPNQSSSAQQSPQVARMAGGTSES